MPLIPFKKMLNIALQNNFAVGYFQAWNQDSLEAILTAGENTDSPLIIGFGGTYVNQEWFNKWGLEYCAALGRVAAAISNVPVCFILNEAETYEQCLKGIKLGFNVVMLNSSYMPFEENLKINKKLVSVAHANDVAVQAELGHLPEGENDSKATLTDPEEAKKFVQETGIDALSVSIGNVHVLTRGKASVDVALVKKIGVAVQIPLVIHGGTGFPPEAVTYVINSGVALFHIGSILKIVYFQGIKEIIRPIDTPKDIQKLVGSREKEDFTTEGKKRITKKVIELMQLYNSEGKANLFI